MRNYFFRKLFLFLLCLLPVIAHAETHQPLLVDKAFQLSVVKANNKEVSLQWKIANDYHLYRERFNFKVMSPEHVTLGKIVLPKGIAEEDPILGKYQEYKNKVQINLPLNHVTKGTKTLMLLVGYQGCADSGFCYPPETKKVSVDLTAVAHSKVTAYSTYEPTTLPIANSTSSQDKVTHLLESKHYFWIALAFLGFGILLSFTPCVLPMIPILSGIIVGQDKKEITTRHAFLLSLSYVIGMAITYALAGVLVALAGSHLTTAFQAPWVIILFSLLFVVLALSLFDFYELRLPSFLEQSVAELSNRQSRSYIGSAIMGALSVLIVSPCVTAPLVGVLTFIAQTGNVFLGALALFMLAVGMGLPLLLIGTSAGKLLPKAGAWMNLIKTSFGVLLLGVAIYLLQRVLPGLITMWLWAALFIISAVYLWKNSKVFFKGMGVVFLVYGIILLVGGSAGNTDPLQPLTNFHNRSVVVSKLPFQRVKTIADVDDAVRKAATQHKLVMLDFYADWCVSCKEMERNTFSDAAVQSALKNAVLLQVDVTQNDVADKALEQHFNVIAPPTMIFFKDGKELKDARIVGEMGPKDFLKHIEAI